MTWGRGSGSCPGAVAQPRLGGPRSCRGKPGRGRWTAPVLLQRPRQTCLPSLSAPPSESQPPLWFLLSPVSRPQLQAPDPPGPAHSRASSRRPHPSALGPDAAIVTGGAREHQRVISALLPRLPHSLGPHPSPGPWSPPPPTF